MEVPCDYCKKSFAEETILKHIGKSNDCKSFYGDKFEEMKKVQQRNKKRNQRKNMTKKQKKEVLKKKRSYDQKPEQKERKKQQYKNKVENEKEEKELKKQQLIEEACNRAKQNALRAEETSSNDDFQRECEFCKKHWDSASLLKHIGNSKDCKSFYGSRFELLKKDHRRQRKQWSRRDIGTEKELERKREKYASNPEEKEKKRKYYEESKVRKKIEQENREKEW